MRARAKHGGGCARKARSRHDATVPSSPSSRHSAPNARAGSRISCSAFRPVATTCTSISCARFPQARSPHRPNAGSGSFSDSSAHEVLKFMARPHIEPYVELNNPWKKRTLPGFPKGIQYKVLSLDTDSGACSLKVRYQPGYEQPPGISYTEYELFVLSGSLQVGDRMHGPGAYFFVPAGV